MENKTKVTSYPSLFNSGLALTASIALIVSSYVFAQDASMSELLYYALALIVITLVGCSISYFAYRRLSNVLDLPIGFIAVNHTVIVIEMSLLLLRSFIHFHVPYGYLLLPIAIDITGAFVLLTIVALLQLKLSDVKKVGIAACLIAGASAALLLTN